MGTFYVTIQVADRLRERYVNVDAMVDTGSTYTSLPESLLAEAQEWVKMGVQVVGGCCGIGPEHIRAFRAGLPARLES